MQLEHWIEEYKPTQIEMNDRQYAMLAALMKENKREYNGIPIVFTDGPNI